MVFSEDNDLSEIRNFETPRREKILTNLEHFLQNQCEYIESMPRKESLYHELKNLKVHIERGLLSGLSPGGGTEKNQRLHRYLNRSFIRLQVSSHVYYARLINVKKGKISWLVLYPSNHSNEGNRVVLPETIETGSSDPDILTEMEDTEETKRYYERVLSMYKTLMSVKRN